MACKILWSPQALEDLRELTGYIALDRPEVAERNGTAIIEKVESLSTHPLLGRIVPERRHPKIREIISNPYRIVYRVRSTPTTIEVLRVWHAARGEPEIRG